MRVEIDEKTKVISLVWEVADSWRVTCQLVRTPDGRGVIRALQIDPIGRVPEDGLTTEVVKAVRLGPARAYATTNAPPYVGIVGAHIGPTATLYPGSLTHEGHPPEVLVAKTKRSRRGRPASLPVSFYRRVSARYNELALSGCKDWSKTLAEEFRYSRTAMRSVIHRVRTGRVPEIALSTTDAIRTATSGKEKKDHGKKTRTR